MAKEVFIESSRFLFLLGVALGISWSPSLGGTIRDWSAGAKLGSPEFDIFGMPALDSGIGSSLGFTGWAEACETTLGLYWVTF